MTTGIAKTNGVRFLIGVGRVGGAIIALALAALIGTALAGSASAGWGWGHGGHGFGHHGMMTGTLDPAEVRERVERMVAHIAIEIDATDEQKQKLTTIFVSAANDLMPIRAEFMQSRQAGELVGLLTGPTVDRAAIETFRAEKMALADQASRRIAQALGEAAEVLTPEQRAEVGERLRFLMEFGRGLHRG
ncbi:MAG TPA: Spy/CpxP family protein refolding chaperone [Bauldia sp.]|nr:Spy/CpxP family protein refolding chaperone [Bauldia sp.]